MKNRFCSIINIEKTKVMAKQDGIIKVQGTLENITFYKTQDGYLMKRKSAVTGSKIKDASNFQRTRENGAEFGHAGKAGKLLRDTFNTLLQNAKDGRVVSRLVQDMMKVVHTDSTSVRGQRNVANGQIALLEGFNFNSNARLDTLLKVAYLTTIDRAAGTLTVNFPSFVPANAVVAPQGTTHLKIVAAGAELDFNAGTSNVQEQEGPMLSWDSTPTPVLSLGNSVTPASRLPLFLVLGVQFYQQVNGLFYPLKGANPLAIIKTA